MSRSPMLWGAGLACALGGAVAGTALGSTPILDRPALGTYYQSHETAPGSSTAEGRVLPDHYPLVTREGTIPVAALADRGLYSQRRYRALYPSYDTTEAQFAEASYQVEADEPQFSSHSAGLSVGDPEPEQAAPTEAEQPLDLAAGPSTLTAAGRAKTIDVETALAMR